MAAVRGTEPTQARRIGIPLATVAILLVASRDVPLLTIQRFWLVVATIVLAALCSWIISWEDPPHDDEGEPPR